ncbi:type 1 fimbrial protein [Salmonella enterica]|nr:type 1 fimbrial protein [Salmonella enterica]EHM9142316.1 type 1 fimbrial protein [Salmonella enterica]EHM9207228.1 type 1 fimbrial protein [Salmonella enterica]EHM9295811.1 type 1 fimbrial protein [Salmonella enterica]EJB9105696.1 type 1 fimbrial protein [Salmonella enterica]
MKSVKHLFLLGTAMAVMSSSAFADTTGTQTFTANVTANTCVVSGLNITLPMGNILASTLKSTKTWGVVGEKHHSFNVSNCPQNITKVDVTPTYVLGAQKDDIKLDHDLGVNAYLALPGTKGALTGPNVWGTGVKKEFTLTNGGYQIDIPVFLLRNGSAITDGSFSGDSLFTIDFG